MAIGSYRHVVTLEAPGTPVPDGQGGYTETWTPLQPAIWHCSVETATAGGLEQVAAGTVLPSVSHIVRGRHHPGITSTTRLRFNGRTLNVVAPPANRSERNLETVVACAEVAT